MNRRELGEKTGDERSLKYGFILVLTKFSISKESLVLIITELKK
jgi:hypothetical protein